tara:strand:- start:124 stop:315 length:192 start_codon:yes stop_codon:yes gene_type:complete
MIELSGSDLAFLITTGTGALVAIIVAVQKSKCSSINMCWGCMNCIRSPEFTENKKEQNPVENI